MVSDPVHPVSAFGCRCACLRASPAGCISAWVESPSTESTWPAIAAGRCRALVGARNVLPSAPRYWASDTPKARSAWAAVPENDEVSTPCPAGVKPCERM